MSKKKYRMDLFDILPSTLRKHTSRYAKRKNGASLIAGIITGAAVGTVAGILLAPKSGKETREDIKEKTGVVASKVKDKTVVAFKTVKGRLSKSNGYSFDSDSEYTDDSEEVKDTEQ